MSKKKSYNSSTIRAELTTTGICVFTILLFVCIVKFSSLIPLTLLLPCILLFETFCIVPIFNHHYFHIRTDGPNNMGIYKMLSFIPLINYTCTMLPRIVKLFYAELIVSVILIISVFIPEVWQLILPANTFLVISDIMNNIFFVLFTIINITIGIGLFSPIKDIEELYTNGITVKKSTKLTEVISYLEIVLLILPLFRIVPLLLVVDKTKAILDSGLTESTILKLRKEL